MALSRSRARAWTALTHAPDGAASGVHPNASQPTGAVVLKPGRASHCANATGTASPNGTWIADGPHHQLPEHQPPGPPRPLHPPLATPTETLTRHDCQPV